MAIMAVLYHRQRGHLLIASTSFMARLDIASWDERGDGKLDDLPTLAMDAAIKLVLSHFEAYEDEAGAASRTPNTAGDNGAPAWPAGLATAISAAS